MDRKDELVPLSVFAKKLNVTVQTVHHAIKTKRIKAKKIGGWYYLNFNTQKKKFDKKAYKKKANGIHVSDSLKADVELKIFKAKVQRLDYEERYGTLVKVEEIKKQWCDVAETLKKSILAIAPRIGALCAAEKTSHGCTQLITVELKRSLERLAVAGLPKEK